MTRSWAMTAMACVACWFAVGCSVLPQGEPDDTGAQGSFRDAADGRFFRKEVVSSRSPLAGYRKALVRRVQVDPKVVAAWQEAGRTEENLTWLVTSAGAALRSELAKGFIVLQDASFGDAQTLVVDLTLTRLAPVAGPGDKTPWYEAPFAPGAEAAMELSVASRDGRTALVRVKDWRSGRQNLSGLAGLDNSARSDTVTIFCYWGRSLRDLLVYEARKQAAGSGGGRPGSALGDAIGATPDAPEPKPEDRRR